MTFRHSSRQSHLQSRSRNNILNSLLLCQTEKSIRGIRWQHTSVRRDYARTDIRRSSLSVCHLSSLTSWRLARAVSLFYETHKKRSAALRFLIKSSPSNWLLPSPRRGSGASCTLSHKALASLFFARRWCVFWIVTAALYIVFLWTSIFNFYCQ